MLSILGDGFAEAFPERSDELYAYASWRRAGIRVAGSSDAPVITADPLLGIRDAVLRRTSSGRVLGPGERLAVRDALAMYTTEAAFAMQREPDIGSLEPGKLADFVVLDRNPLDTEPEQIAEIRVLATVVGGQPIFQEMSRPSSYDRREPTPGQGPGRQAAFQQAKAQFPWPEVLPPSRALNRAGVTVRRTGNDRTGRPAAAGLRQVAADTTALPVLTPAPTLAGLSWIS